MALSSSVIHTYLTGSCQLHMALSSSVIHTYLAGSSQLHMALSSCHSHLLGRIESVTHGSFVFCHSHLLGRIESVTHGSFVLSFTLTWQDRVSYTRLFRLVIHTYLAGSSQLHMALLSCHSHLLGRIESVTHGSFVLSFTLTWCVRVLLML